MPALSSAAPLGAPRSRFVYHLSSERANYGHPYHLLDVDVVDKNSGDSEYRRQKLPGFDAQPRAILTHGFQAQPQQATQATQTRPNIKTNQSVQTHFQTLSAAEIEQQTQTATFAAFLSSASQNVLGALLLNDTIDLFKDDLQVGDDDEDEAGPATTANGANPSSSLSAHSISLFHSFHHLSLSKHHTVNSVEWHPHRACIAFSLTPSWSFDQWCEHSGEVSLSYILLYDLGSLLQPYCVIKVPGLVTTFKFHPQQPAYLAAGLQTGQCILYQISPNKKQHKHALKDTHSSTSGNKDNQTDGKPSTAPRNVASSSSFLSSLTSPGLDSNSSSLLPSPLYALLSNLDRSHGRPVTDIHWLPTAQQVNRKGELLAINQRPASREAHSAQTANTSIGTIASQFLSLAGDGRILYWDMKHLNEPPSHSYTTHSANAAVTSFQGTGSLDDGLFFNAHQHEQRDGKWSPIFVLPLSTSLGNAASSGDGEGGEKAGGRSNEAEMLAAVNSHVKVSVAFPVSSGITSRKLAPGAANSWHHFTSLTEDGEILEVDSGTRPASLGARTRVHSSMGNSIDRSTLLPELYLSCGDTTWALWVTGHEWPIFVSPPVTLGSYACARFSPTRPAVIAVSRSDGVIEIWDCLDASHAPAYQFGIGAEDRVINLAFQHTHATIAADLRATLPFLSPYSATRQYLAAGDSAGKCHIVEMPRPLRRKVANEEQHMRAFFERETKRGKFAQAREAVKRTGRTPLTPYTELQLSIKSRQDNQNKLTDAEAEAAYEAMCRELGTGAGR